MADAAEALRHAHEARRAAELAEVVALTALCDLYRVDADAAGAGQERLERGGADGTPLIGEFLALEVAGLLEISPAQAGHRLAAALDLRHRLPCTWAAVLAGEVDARSAQLLSERTTAAGLDAGAAAHVDRRIAAALPLMPVGRVLRAVRGWIVAADPELAARRAREAAERRGVWVDPVVDAHRTLFAQLDARDAFDVEAAVGELAVAWGAAGDQRDLGVRRASALGSICRHALASHPDLTDGTGGGGPGTITGMRRTSRKAMLVVHVGHEAVTAPDGQGVARLEGHGPMLWGDVVALLAGARVTVQPVIDPAEVAPVDAYEIPDRMRFAVEQRNPVDVFPYGTRPARSCQLDHTRPYRRGAPPGSGQTGVDNLGPLSIRAHRAKTHAGWRLEQPEAGVFWWTSPLGYRYTVTPHGTVAGAPHRRPLPAFPESAEDVANEAFDAWLLNGQDVPAWLPRPWEDDFTHADAILLREVWQESEGPFADQMA